MAKRPQFATGEIYHIFNRGVEKRHIFSNQSDYFRFIHDMFEFNDENPAINLGYYFDSYGKRPFAGNLAKSDFAKLQMPRKMLVEIFCFCLMPNHYHFIIRQLADNGITEFMRKIGTGYTNYFNTKYQRVGPLFQGKFKAVHIFNQAHLLYLPHYIHLNPLDTSFPEWREKKISNVRKALQFLESYRWSSYQDYIGIKNFPSITQRNFLTKIYGLRKTSDYKKDMTDWLQGLNTETIRDIVIE